mmetsp:Transcript_12200/g.27928  ORF Transcript_12200/g.27928 Transcript_12200/m.27928 type:complete len:162 (-) Transcript_12200:42-527(-)
MASTLFSTKEVVFGGARFPSARVGYNAAARCLNLLVPGARCGAIELLRGLEGASDLHAEGTKCTIGKAQHIAVIFDTEEQVQAFQARLARGSKDVALGKKEATIADVTEKIPLATAGNAEATPAPSTPPTRAPAARRLELSPPRTKRARVEAAAEAAPCKK